VSIDDNDDATNDGIVTYENAESLAVYGLEGSDTFTVTGGPIPIFIDGGDPIGALPGDVLIVTNAFAFFAARKRTKADS
jgi:large repetitive protein